MSRPDASLQALTIGFPNLAGVGLPIVASVLGPAGTVPIAVALAAGSILVSPLTLIIVEMSNARAHGAELSATQVLTAIRRALTKPVVVAPALGILLSLSGLELDALAHACLSLIGSAAAGVALFLTGLILSAQSFRLDWKVVGATAASDIIRPLSGRCRRLLSFRLRRRRQRSPSCSPQCRRASSAFSLRSTIGWTPPPWDPWSPRAPVFSIVTMAIAIAVLFPALRRRHGARDPVLGARQAASGHVRPDGRGAGSREAVRACGKIAWRPDPRDFVRNETGEALHRNRAGQILCTVQALAAAAALTDAMPARLIVAGYSVGEVAAWGVGGLLSATDTLDLVAAGRKPWMPQRSPVTG